MEVDERLIVEIKKFPHLYDQQKSHYRDPVKRDIAWRNLSATMALSVDDCQRRWKNLRDRFSRERRFLKRGGGHPKSSDEFGPTVRWPYYDAMSYFSAYVRPRRSAYKRTTMDEFFSNYQIEPKIESICSTPEIPTYCLDPESSSGVPEEDHIESASGENESILPDSGDGERVCMTSSRSREEDQSAIGLPMNGFDMSHVRTLFTNEDDLFGLSIAATLKRLPPRSKAFAKLKMQEILCEVEFGQSAEEWEH